MEENIQETLEKGKDLIARVKHVDSTQAPKEGIVYKIDKDLAYFAFKKGGVIYGIDMITNFEFNANINNKFLDITYTARYGGEYLINDIPILEKIENKLKEKNCKMEEERKLIRLEQRVNNNFFEQALIYYNNDSICIRYISQIGKIKTLTLENPVLDVDGELQEMLKRKDRFIPEKANAYLCSEFNPEAQFVRNGKFYSVYAIQFYLYANL